MKLSFGDSMRKSYLGRLYLCVAVLCALLFLSAQAMAAGLLRQTVPLERAGVALHLEA